MSNTIELLLEFINTEEFATALEHFKASKEPKKEWEVVVFKRHGEMYKIVEGWQESWLQPIYRGPVTQYSMNECLAPENDFAIWSISRLSDGEIFSVGDRIKSPGFPNGAVIETFKVESEKLFLSLDKGCGLMEVKPGHLEQVVKLPAPLFTTLDGVEIAIGNQFVVVDRDSDILGPITATEGEKLHWERIGPTFSTREAAETYLVNNKPCLSVEDVNSLLVKCIGYDATKEINAFLVDLVKSKLNP